MIPSAGEILGDIDGGRVLDVATGTGGFVETLVDGLAGYDEIVGIDMDAGRGERFAEAHAERPRVRFERRDAYATGYPDASFDTVSLSNSLHHLAQPAAALLEMLRVLRPGGRLVVFEMYRDVPEPAQLTHVELHHWWGAVDTRRGIVHRPTFLRQEILDLVAPLRLDGLLVTDVGFPEDDPLDPDSLAELDEVIDRYLAWADGDPFLVSRGHELRTRLHEVGILGASSLAIVGRKPPASAQAAPSTSR